MFYLFKINMLKHGNRQYIITKNKTDFELINVNAK